MNVGNDVQDPSKCTFHALELAQLATRISSPNPRVGCILVHTSGQVLGVGHTEQAGGAHAEVMALRDARAQGHTVTGVTAYITLEPCAHRGRTGPCVDALIAAGIKKVVATIEDPNPLVAGQGFAKLRAAGVEVEVLPPDSPEAIASRELNIGFFSRMIRKTPWVRMKLAASLDGVTALGNGKSQWITSEAARTDGHAWRARSCAMLTGIGTVLADNPRLDVRLVQTPRQPHVVVVDSKLELPLDAALLQAQHKVFVYAAVQNDAKQQALEALGAHVIYLPGPSGKVDLAAMMRDLGAREINELHVEAGAKLNGSLLREGLVDELLVYLAPKLLGAGAGLAENIFAQGPLADLGGAVALEFKSVEMLGPDLRVLARLSGRDKF
jgi:diaminohydroxyphosphoribosylaminopyrimidine deaminase / 5-amino-6-(5-phosphoribosylamino)uracil reductase